MGSLNFGFNKSQRVVYFLWFFTLLLKRPQHENYTASVASL